MCVKGQSSSSNNTTKDNISTGNDIKDQATTTTKLRILLCSENVSPQLNGIARRVSEYEQGFAQAGHHVDVLHPYCTGKTWCLPHPWNADARMMMIRPDYFVQHMLTQHSEYDIVHVVMPLNFSGAWILAASELIRAFDMRGIINNKNKHKHHHNAGADGTKYPALVISYHLNATDYIDIYSPPGVRDFQKFLMFTCLSRVLPLISDRILAPTRATEPRLLELWPESKIGLCHTGISSDFCPTAIEGQHGKRWLMRKQDFLKITGRKHLLLCVGRLAPEKGINHLLAALSFLPDCALWIVGDGPYRRQAEKIVRTHHLPVDFLGYQRNEALCSVYGAADCFVCPSQTETYGQVVQEAFATGARVALPRVPQFVEAYQHLLHEHAWWVPNDTESMVAAIASQVKLPPLTPQEKNNIRSKVMTWSEACDAMLVEYAEALKVARMGKAKLTPVNIVLVIFWVFVTVVVNSVGHVVYALTAVVSKLLRLHKTFYVK